MLMRSPLARERRRPPGFILPCQPVDADTVPAGNGWLHELKHDGFRIIARKQGDGVRLWSRNGRDWTAEFVAIAAALRELPGAFILDGEAVAHCGEGLPDFHRLLRREGQASACLYAFDLLHLNTTDLRPVELAGRRTMLRKLLRTAGPALIFSEHMEGQDGEAMFRHACALGLEGIVSKRLDRPYSSGRCRHWRKVRNPAYQRR
jgi:bifunctional non-homologous end joining protein LigD